MTTGLYITNMETERARWLGLNEGTLHLIMYDKQRGERNVISTGQH